MFSNILFVLILSIVRSNCQTIISCNGGIECTEFSNKVTCGITPSPSHYFKNLEECFTNMTVSTLEILKEIPGDITLDINSVIDATSYIFLNSAPSGTFILSATEYNLAVNSIIFQNNAFFLNQTEDFFCFFPNIETIETCNAYLKFGFQPSFSTFQSLQNLVVNVFDPNGDYGVFTVGMVQNLGLRFLKWSGNLNEIEPGSLNGLSNLTSLDLSGNLLTTLPDNLFSQTSNLKEINLNGNMLNSFSDNIFAGLNSITSISIDNNPGFPIQSLQKLKSLRSISLKYNSYMTLDYYTFQQLPNLTNVSLDGNPFSCDCELRWTSFMSTYGISIEGGKCFTPLTAYDKPISDEMPYFGCPQSNTFPCFNKSIDCRSVREDFSCHNTEDGGYLCNCDVGLAYTHTRECVDSNECTSNISKCENICVNTFGSYECACPNGYSLNSDGVSCSDVNECLELNGGCEGGCGNMEGAYECFCGNGYKVENGTDCVKELGQLPYIIWGGVASALLLVLLISFILLFVCICLCRKKRADSSVQNIQLPQQPSTPSSYTRMDSTKPPIPGNRPALPAPRVTEQTKPKFPQPTFHHEELTYEAFDVDN